MTVEAPKSLSVEYRISGLYGDPAVVAEQMAAAERFTQILTDAGFAVDEEGESGERWFEATVPADQLTTILDALAAANVVVAVRSSNFDRGSDLATQLAAHPAVDDVDFELTAEERAQRDADLAAAKARPLSERDPWRHAIASRSEVRVVATLDDDSEASGWCQVDGLTDDGVSTPRITLDDGRVVFGSECGWQYVEPYQYRPLPAASGPERLTFDFTLTATKAIHGADIDPAVVRETMRRALAEALAHASDQFVISDLVLGLDGKALPSTNDLYDRAYAGTAYASSDVAPGDEIFDRPYDPTARSPNDEIDADDD